MRHRLLSRIARRPSHAGYRLTSLIRGASAVARILRLTASNRNVGLVVLFHRVSERPGDPDRELVPAVSVVQFRRQLRWMSRLFRVVPASQIHVESCSRRRWRRIPIAVTFDDEFSTHVILALPALRRQRVRATFFLTGAQLDGPAPFWWELLQEAADRGVSTQRIVPGKDIFEQAAHVTAAGPAKRDEIAAALSSLSPAAAARTMQPEDITRLAAEHDIAFHTRHHRRLDTLTDPELSAALREGREELERLVARPLTLLAYPHGAAGPREARAAREAGFSLGFTTNWHPCGCASDPLLIGRIEPGPVSSSGFLQILSHAMHARADSR